MTADEFVVWSMTQPDCYEQEDGVLVRMASERAAHARTRHRMAELLSAAVSAGKLRCEACPDGMAARVDQRTVYEPDALLRCGDRPDDDVGIGTDPMMVVEVVSPGSGSMGSGAKLAGYVRLPGMRHYLIARTRDRVTIQHGRTADGAILTRIVQDGAVALHPPGIVLDGLFAD